VKARTLDMARKRAMIDALGQFQPIGPVAADNALNLASAIEPAPIVPYTEEADPNAPSRRAVADVLANPATVESGAWAEALAEGLAQGLRGMAARDQYEEEARERREAREERENRRRALGAAARITGEDPAQVARERAAALAEYAPEEAFDLTQGLTQADIERQGRRSDYVFEQDEEDRRSRPRGQLENELAIERARALAPLEIEIARASRAGGGRAAELRGADRETMNPRHAAAAGDRRHLGL
jgi:hypothetical protein